MLRSYAANVGKRAQRLVLLLAVLYIWNIFSFITVGREAYCILQQLLSVKKTHTKKWGKSTLLTTSCMFVQGTDLRWVKNDGIFTQPESRYFTENIVPVPRRVPTLTKYCLFAKARMSLISCLLSGFNRKPKRILSIINFSILTQALSLRNLDPVPFSLRERSSLFFWSRILVRSKISESDSGPGPWSGSPQACQPLIQFEMFGQVV